MVIILILVVLAAAVLLVSYIAYRMAFRLGARLFGHFNLNETTVIDEVKNKEIPILLLHGEADSYVPFEMSREIYEANPENIIFESFAGADYGLSFLAEPERYTKIVNDFISDCLK